MVQSTRLISEGRRFDSFTAYSSCGSLVLEDEAVRDRTRLESGVDPQGSGIRVLHLPLLVYLKGVKKSCPRCGKSRPVSDFSFRNKAKGTRASYCKLCHRKIRNKLYYASPLPDQTRIRQRVREIQQWLNDYRRQLTCPCGENHPGCLVFHHIDPNTKELPVSQVAQRGWGRDRIMREIAKCQILCANCHSKLHWNERHKHASYA